LKHAFFTRHGGYSQAPFDSLNVAYGIGDVRNAVDRNIHKIKEALNAREIVWVKQTHGSGVVVVDDRFLAAGQIHGATSGDAFVTSKTGVALLIKVADCQAIFLHDVERKVIANIHCGWRGNVNGIIPQTISVMKKVYGCVPGNMIGGICPSLGPCCGEFKGCKELLPGSFQRYREKGEFFNFWAISRDQLVESGLQSQNIELSRICTVCDGSDFFSYRKETKTGRGAAVIMLSDLHASKSQNEA